MDVPGAGTWFSLEDNNIDGRHKAKIDNELYKDKVKVTVNKESLLTEEEKKVKNTKFIAYKYSWKIVADGPVVKELETPVGTFFLVLLPNEYQDDNEHALLYFVPKIEALHSGNRMAGTVCMDCPYRDPKIEK